MHIPLSTHILCPTCVIEFETHRGAFESRRARDAILNGQLVEGCYDRRYCCRCGQECTVIATFEQAEGSVYPCDGKHVEVLPDEPA